MHLGGVVGLVLDVVVGGLQLVWLFAQRRPSIVSVACAALPLLLVRVILRACVLWPRKRRWIVLFFWCLAHMISTRNCLPLCFLALVDSFWRHMTRNTFVPAIGSCYWHCPPLPAWEWTSRKIILNCSSLPMLLLAFAVEVCRHIGYRHRQVERHALWRGRAGETLRCVLWFGNLLPPNAASARAMADDIIGDGSWMESTGQDDRGRVKA